MSCLGVLFSLDHETVLQLKSRDSDGRLDYLKTEIEETFMNMHPDKFAELAQSWDALHRSLTDGHLAFDNGKFPLNHVILGGENLYEKDDYIMTLKTPEQVQHIALAVEMIDADTLKNGYHKINQDDYGIELSTEDFEYTWTWFKESKDFWKIAASEMRYVLFTVDQ